MTDTEESKRVNSERKLWDQQTLRITSEKRISQCLEQYPALMLGEEPDHVSSTRDTHFTQKTDLMNTHEYPKISRYRQG